MTEGPAQAMERFIHLYKSVPNLFTPIYTTPDDALNDGANFIRPFLSNPELYSRHVRIILEGIAGQFTVSALRPMFTFLNSPIAKIFRFTKEERAAPRKITSDFIEKLEFARSDLLKSLRFFADWAAKKWPLRGSLKLGVGCL
jgi:hypothetical protein